MKYIICILCLSLISVGFVGCSSVSTTPVIADEIIEIPGESIPQIPADAAMYRGIVSDYSVSGEQTTFTLSEYEGTDFGADSISVLVTRNTIVTDEFTQNTIADGDYIEISYGGIPNDVVSAITAKKLAPADIVNFNGKLVEIIKNGEKTDYLMSYLNDENHTIIFHINDTTKLYLDQASLKVGDVLNIFHSGAVTMSLPGQGNAIEVRKFAE